MPIEKRCKIVICLFAAVLAAMAFLPATLLAAEVSYLVPPVEIKRQGTTQWLVLNLGDQVNMGDTIRTGIGARVEVTISKKRVFRVGQASEIGLPELSDQPNEGIRAKFRLLLGRFWVGLVRPLRGSQGERFEVSTVTAVIGVKGTRFGVDYDKSSKASQVIVIEGTIGAAAPPQETGGPEEVTGPREVAPPQEISMADWYVLVERDQKLTIRPGEAPKVEPLTAEDKKDEWVSFNIARDNDLAASP